MSPFIFQMNNLTGADILANKAAVVTFLDEEYDDYYYRTAFTERYMNGDHPTERLICIIELEGKIGCAATHRKSGETPESLKRRAAENLAAQLQGPK